MRYVKIGKLSYSNKKEYIGEIIEVSKYNFELICNKIDSKINGGFKKNRDNFIYALEYDEEKNNEIILDVKIKLFIAYNYYNKWELDLFFELNKPDKKPFRIIRKDILRS